MPEPLAAIRPSQAEEQPPVTEQRQRIGNRLALVVEQPPAVAQVPTEEARWRTAVLPVVVRRTVEPRVRAAVRLPTAEVQVPTAVRLLIGEAQTQTAVPLPTEEMQAQTAVRPLIGEAQTQTVVVRPLVAEARVRAVEAPWRIEEVQTRVVEVRWRIGEARAPATAEQWLAAVGHRPVTLVVAAVTPQLEVGGATAGRAVLDLSKHE